MILFVGNDVSTISESHFVIHTNAIRSFEMLKVYTVKLARLIPGSTHRTIAPRTIQIRGVRITGSHAVNKRLTVSRMCGDKASGMNRISPGESVVIGSGINRVRVEYVGDSPLLSEFKVTCLKVRSIKATNRPPAQFPRLHNNWDVLEIAAN